MAIHPTAIVDPKAQIGRDVSIGAYSVVGPDVVLGDRAHVSHHVVIEGKTRVGADTEVLPFAMLGAPPGHLMDRGEGTELVIGARVSIREFVSLHRGTNSGSGRTVIGDECSFFAHAHVGHDCVLGRGVLLINASMLGGHVTVEDHATFGGNSGAHQFCRVGTLGMIAGQVAIRMDVPPYCLCGGEGARLLGLNEVGLERRGFTAETVKALRTAYRIVFRSGLRREPALGRLRAEFDGVREVARFADFIAASKRGVARHGRE